MRNESIQNYMQPPDVLGVRSESPTDPQLHVDSMKQHHRVEFAGQTSRRARSVEAFLALPDMVRDESRVSPEQRDHLRGWLDRAWSVCGNPSFTYQDATRIVGELKREIRGNISNSELHRGFDKAIDLLLGYKRIATVDSQFVNDVTASFDGVPQLDPADSERGYDYALLLTYGDLWSVLRDEHKGGMPVHKLIYRLKGPYSDGGVQNRVPVSMEQLILDPSIPASDEVKTMARTLALFEGFRPGMDSQDELDYIRYKKSGVPLYMDHKALERRAPLFVDVPGYIPVYLSEDDHASLRRAAHNELTPRLTQYIRGGLSDDDLVDAYASLLSERTAGIGPALPAASNRFRQSILDARDLYRSRYAQQAEELVRDVVQLLPSQLAPYTQYIEQQLQARFSSIPDIRSLQSVLTDDLVRVLESQGFVVSQDVRENVLIPYLEQIQRQYQSRLRIVQPVIDSVVAEGVDRVVPVFSRAEVDVLNIPGTVVRKPDGTLDADASTTYFGELDKWFSANGSRGKIISPRAANREAPQLALGRIPDFVFDAMAPLSAKQPPVDGVTLYVRNQGLMCDCNGYLQFFDGFSPEFAMSAVDARVLISPSNWAAKIARPAVAYFSHWVKEASEHMLTSKDIYRAFDRPGAVGTERYSLSEALRLRVMYTWAYIGELLQSGINETDEAYRVSWNRIKGIRHQIEDERYGDTVNQLLLGLPYGEPLGKQLRQYGPRSMMRTMLVDASLYDKGVVEEHGYDWWKNYFAKTYGEQQLIQVGGVALRRALPGMHEMFHLKKDGQGRRIHGGVQNSRGEWVQVTYEDLLAYAGLREVRVESHLANGDTVPVMKLERDPSPRLLDPLIEKAIAYFENAGDTRIDDKKVRPANRYHYDQIAEFMYEVSWQWEKTDGPMAYVTESFQKEVMRSRNHNAFDPVQSLDLLRGPVDLQRSWRFGVHPEHSPYKMYTNWMRCVLKAPLASQVREDDLWMLSPLPLTQHDGAPVVYKGKEVMVAQVVDPEYRDPVLLSLGVELPGYASTHTLTKDFIPRKSFVPGHYHSAGSETCLYEESTATSAERSTWPMPLARTTALIDNPYVLIERDPARLIELAYHEAHEAIKRGTARHQDLHREAEYIWEQGKFYEHGFDVFTVRRLLDAMRAREMLEKESYEHQINRFGCYMESVPRVGPDFLSGNIAIALDTFEFLGIRNDEFKEHVEGAEKGDAGLAKRSAQILKEVAPATGIGNLVISEVGSATATGVRKTWREIKRVGVPPVLVGAALEAVYQVAPHMLIDFSRWTAGGLMPEGLFLKSLEVAGVLLLGSTVLNANKGKILSAEKLSKRPELNPIVVGDYRPWLSIEAARRGLLLNRPHGASSITGYADELNKKFNVAYGTGS